MTESQSGRITGRQAQIRITAGSAVDQIEKWKIPVVKMLGETMEMARAREMATAL